jgi:hypothetical protein
MKRAFSGNRDASGAAPAALSNSIKYRPVLALALCLAAALTLALAMTGQARAAADPAECTTNVTFDPSIPTFEDVTGRMLGAGGTGVTSRSTTSVLYGYMDAIVAATATNPRVRVIKQSLGTTELGRDYPMVIVSTPDNIANLDAGRNHAAFWRGVRDGSIPAAVALSQIKTRPALGFLTGTPHGNEPAGGDALMRNLYELVARTDCANSQRLRNLINFIMPSRNPDGRDNLVRTSAWAFDHNRDVGTRTQSESKIAFFGSNPYPNIYYVDAHQQSNGYFFPPNEDPVHHEISDASIDLINNTFGAAIQDKFNDQSLAYRNYNAYDLFSPVYGDSVPALMWGGAGMTFEKGTSELYAKQVYDHYLAMDTTVNTASRDKERILTEWILQWQEAKEQGERCELQENKLVAPFRTEADLVQQPDTEVCGYYYLPDNHPGDTAGLLKELQQVGVEVYELTQDTVVDGAHTIGPGETVDGRTLPAGTLWIPMAQTQKHWIQAVLGEDPFVPYYFFYDVGQWSYSHTWGMSGGNGLLREPMPSNTPMVPVEAVDFSGVSNPNKPVLAFKTDSSKGMAMVVDLLAEGVTVYRGTEAFSAGGRNFPTGTAMIDASTLGSVDLAAIADERDNPVTGIDNYPVPRYDLGGAPKIALYTGSSTVPATPLSTPQGQCGNSTFCWPLFSLTQKLGFAPTSNTDADTPIIVPVTTTDLASSPTWLKDNGFTAFYGGSNVTGATNLANLQDFVNSGGRYVGWGTNGLTAARSAGITNVNTVSTSASNPTFSNPCPVSSGLRTSGANFPADINTDNPVGWSYDNGGSIFRSTANAVYDPATLAGSGPIPDAIPVFSFPTPLVTFGYSCNATGPGQLEGRPAIIQQPFGAGSAVFFEQDPFYRSWLPQQERTALNALLFPTGAELPATAPAAPDVVLTSDSEPIPDKALRPVKTRPAVVGHDAGTDLRIKVYRGKANRQARVFAAAVKQARIPAGPRKKIRWIRTRNTVGIKIKGGATFDLERVPLWVHRLDIYMSKRKVKAYVWEIVRLG